MLTAEIRSAYLEFFGARDHKVVSSSSLVPGNDPTLLFTNAGMVQFKDALTGRERLDYTRATSCQRCVRAGGKHNDLENVGHTARHHTLFEMLGNFSFGDYFKEEAIDWAWEFVRDVLGWPRDRLWVTVHPTDDEARRLWLDKIGMPADRVIDHEENFWAMGDTGPCGPNTEIFYDQGPAVAGGPPGTPEEDGDRFLEFWNLVFPQFDRSPDGTLEPLASPGIDTGMGLERTAAIAQGVLTNFEADVFRGVMMRAARMAGIRGETDIAANVSLRVIADHIRAASFLIADGVLPSNEDRGYVLRRIIRRALRHGHQLDLREPFFHGLVAPLAEEMGQAYPLLEERRSSIEAVLLGEEERFARTLDRGMVLLERTIGDLSGDTIPGAVAFELYDTYGFPVDLTADVARERGLRVDTGGFEAVMETQRARSREATRFDASEEQQVRVDSKATSPSPARPTWWRSSAPGMARRRRRPGSRRRKVASWSSTGRRSTRKRVARWAIPERLPATASVSRWTTPRAAAASTCTGAGSPKALSRSDRKSRPPWTARAGPTSSSTTPRRTCCTRRCATCWARMSSRRAPSWRRTGCVSISRIPRP